MTTEKIPISAVWPLQDGTLQIVFDTGNTAEVRFSSKFEVTRFSPLKDEVIWKSAKTDGKFVRWYRDDFPVVEMAYDELMRMIVGQEYY